MSSTWDPLSPTPDQALAQLVAGNTRFREGAPIAATRTWNPEVAARAQRPFAIILGCSDSRTPVEILFDQGFGDLFVVRVAGNIVAPPIVGSIEFAASQFGARLVVVMGHTNCGAVAATVDSLHTGTGSASKNIRSITDRIAPNIAGLVGQHRAQDELREAVRANVRASVNHLRHGSQILEELVLSGRLAVIGAEYELASGTVHFFEAPSSGDA